MIAGGGAGSGCIPAVRGRSWPALVDSDAISRDAASTDADTATMRAVPAGSRARLTRVRSCTAGSGIQMTRVPIGVTPVAAAQRGFLPGVSG